LPQGRVGGDAGAQEGGGAGGVEAVGDAQDELLVDHDLGGVAAEGGGGAVHLGAVVGKRHALLAELFLVVVAGAAGAAAVDHAADAGQVAGGEAGDLAPTRVTRPMISWPGTMGKVAPPHSSRAWWMSEWQTPQ
jgi:hypothetical protein